MTDKKEKVRIDISNYDPADGYGKSVAYHFNIDETEKILDFLKVNIDAGMYVLVYPWFIADEKGGRR